MSTQTVVTEKMQKDIDRLTGLRDEIFDMANSHAGNDSGTAALHLHQCANSMTKALRCLERGNPKEPIPEEFIPPSLGFYFCDRM